MLSDSDYQRRGSMYKRNVKIKNVGDERPECIDTLHQRSIEGVRCSSEHCKGSLVDIGVVGNAPRPKEELLLHARDFIDQYYQSRKRNNTQSHFDRLEEVEKSIETSGTYDLTTAELTYRARTAWRNAPRCIGRIQWSNLQVFDARHITTTREMFAAICNHITYATDKGNIRSTMTVFPARTDGKHDYRVWNRQFINYAGYKEEDGSVKGDPLNVEFTEDIAKRMGFDTRKSVTLWKDRTLVEINVAVLHSFQSQGVTITDHHDASDSFMKHLDNEQKLRGGCPEDWVWIVPPMSGGILPVFHQEMLLYRLKPSFEYMVVSMDDYDVKELEHETLVLVVSSTFGTGDPPENGEVFANRLFEIKHPESIDRFAKQTSYMRMTSSYRDDDAFQPEVTFTEVSKAVEDSLTLTGPLSNVRYSVFGLGSRAYPNFCAFAHYVDNIFYDLGAARIFKMMEGDNLCGQEESFRTWAKNTYKAACDTFCVGGDTKDVGVLAGADNLWKPEQFRLTPAQKEKEVDIIEGLTHVHKKTVLPFKFISRTQLQSPESDRQTILVKLGTTSNVSEIQYQPGDHVAIFPKNSSTLVNAILARLQKTPSTEQLIKIEVLKEQSIPLGSSKTWEQYSRIPVCTLKTAFSRFLDITTPPGRTLLKLFASQATQDCDRERLEQLASDPQQYEEWIHMKQPNVVQVIDEFPSLRIAPSLLLSQLPLLQSRYYSISSSLMSSPGEVHVTLSVVRFRAQEDTGTLHEGVCSNWLNRLEEGSTVPCIIRHAASFHMPDDKTRPMILVGPGTGIAPFRSFWHQRKIDKEMMQPQSHGLETALGAIVLYFGCRNTTVDDIYKEELEQMKEEEVLKEVHKALSRQPTQPKTYVQNILEQNSSEVYKTIVVESGHFYVCGDAKMANDVTSTLEKILSTEEKMTLQDAKKFILKLRDGNRFHEDIFGIKLKNSEITDRASDQAKNAAGYQNTKRHIKSTRKDYV